MIAMFYTRLGQLAAWGEAYTSATFVEALADFPVSIVPDRRKQRPYISSILAKNEATRTGPHNRRLFHRVKHGHYIINPHLSLLVEGKWRNVYDLLALDALGYDRGPADDAHDNARDLVTWSHVTRPGTGFGDRSGDR